MVVEPDSWLWPPDYYEDPNQVGNFLDDLDEIYDVLAAEMQLDEDQQVSRDLRQIREFGAVLPKIKTKLIKWKTEGF